MALLRSVLALMLLLSLSYLRSVLPSPPPAWSGPHITDLNVLLPPRMTDPVHYRLVGTGGCFTWSWDHHDILFVQPEFNDSDGCSTSARLTSIESYSGRKETAVYAADANTGTVIRCEVFIDKITRIQIFHHSIKLDLGGLTELRIRAFDDNDNVFSSLVGVRFKWRLIPNASDTNNVNHLAHVPLKETPLSDCSGFCGDLDMQIKIEDSGVGSDLYVVKGIEIGHETVTAQLLEHHVEHVTDKIVLTVAEMMSLNPPSPVFVIIGTLVAYKLRVIRQNTPKEIDLPSLYHRWSVSNDTVATIDLLMGTVVATCLGVTNIIVEDIRVSGHRQTSVMHVVIPEGLTLHLIPVTNALKPLDGVWDYPSSKAWYIVAGLQYTVHLKVFSSKPEEKEIHLTENNVLNIESSESTLWSLTSIEGHNQYNRHNSRLLQPHTEGQGLIAASLSYYSGMQETAEVLKVEKLVIVCNKISVHAGSKVVPTKVIHLPWAPGLHQKLELAASGGCAKTVKDYKWFSSNEDIASISALGVVRAERPGQAIIKVASAYDKINYAEVTIEVSIPSSMIMLPYFPVEAIVGSDLQAAVTFNSSSGRYYDRCDAFRFAIKWSVLSDGDCFKLVNSTTYHGLEVPSAIDESGELHALCSWASIYSYCPRRARLHAIFTNEMLPTYQLHAGQIHLQASKLIASYLPLLARQAGDGNQFGGYWFDLEKAPDKVHDDTLDGLTELYLAPGASMDILVLGGPERWGQSVDFVDSVNASGIDIKNQCVGNVLLKHGPAKGGQLYTISCQTIGDYQFVFSRGNLIGPDHLLPIIENLGLSVVCSFPFMISVIANQFANTHEVIQSSLREIRGPENIHLSPISVANGQKVRISVVGIHSTGRVFANSSSLRLRWELSECEKLAHWETTTDSYRSLTDWEKFLVLHNSTGQCVVRATVIGLSETAAAFVSEKMDVLFQGTESVTDAIKLQLVSTLRIDPETAVLLSHSEAKINMSIIGGTCFLEAVLNDTEVAKILPHPGTAECSWLLLAARQLGISLLTIYDKGLSPPASAVAVVKVSSIEWVKIISDDKIFVLVGTTTRFEILAGTRDGSTFHSSQYVYMNIHLHTDEDILKTLMDGTAKTGSSIHFQTKAENIGITTLYVSIRGHSGNWITSQRISVEVYSQLIIHPNYIFLAPGAAYTVVASGGPATEATVEYSSLNPDVALVNKSSGMLAALSVGNTTVRVAFYGNARSLICEAYGRVEVGIPPKMILHVQSDQLCIGCKMPIFPSYPEGNLFSFYEVCNGYGWSIEDEKVLSFESSGPFYSGLGMQLDRSHDEDFGYINTLSGRSAGASNVSVSFSCNFLSSGAVLITSYVASRVLTVVHDPPLALGIPITWVLPPFYTTSDILPGSSVSLGRDFRSHKKNVVYSVLKSCENGHLIQEDPISIMGTKIKTLESNNIGCIQAKDESGRTEIACCIRVSEVSQVRVITKTPSYVVHLGVNDQLELNAGYCDYLGYPFLEAHEVVSLDIEINYHDIVSIHRPLNKDYSKGNFYIQAQKHGKALIKVFFKENPGKAAYFLVVVGAQLVPQNPILRVGNLVNFSIIGDVGGRWLSTNESVISINKITGQAVAHSVGKANVYFESSSTKLKTTVTVIKGEQIQVHAPTQTLTNVDVPVGGYRFLVDLSHHLPHRLDFGATLDNMYDCWVHPPFAGYAKPWMDHDLGVFYCIFFPYSPKHFVSLVSKQNMTRGHGTGSTHGVVYVSITASLREAQHIMGSALVSFVGGFSVSVDRLDLTSESNSSLLIVTGNTDVQINWNKKDFLNVILILKNDFGACAEAKYEVRVLKNVGFTDKINIVLPATGQSAEVEVTFDPGVERPPNQRNGATWTAAVACLLMLMWTAIAFVRLLDRPDSSRSVERQVPPPPPGAFGSPLIPERSSAGSMPSPVRTPQPLMGYARTTIDETPYYKRSGRRLFDPRNSY